MTTLDEAIRCIQAGNLEEGRTILEQLLEKDEFNEQLWFWLSKAVEPVESRIICLENVLAINPNNAEALAQLEELGALTKSSTEKDGVKTKSTEKDYVETKQNPPLIAIDEIQSLSRPKTSEQLLQMVQEYHAMLSHDIRTPLTAIRAYTELLLSDKVGPLNERQKEFLTTLKNLAENLMITFDDYTNFYRAISGNLFLKFEAVDLKEIVLKIRLDEVEVNIPDNLPKILADRRRLQQALENIFAEVFPRYYKVGEFKPSLKISYDNDWITINIVTLEEMAPFYDSNYSSLWLFYSQIILEEHKGQFRFRKVEDKVEVILSLPITQDGITVQP